jgi:hypothetical protein
LSQKWSPDASADSVKSGIVNLGWIDVVRISAGMGSRNSDRLFRVTVKEEMSLNVKMEVNFHAISAPER